MKFRKIRSLIAETSVLHKKRHLQLIPAGVQKRMESSALADGVNIPEKTCWDFWYEVPAGYIFVAKKSRCLRRG